MPKPKPQNTSATAEQIGKLIFDPPPSNAPGYLLRQRRASTFSTAQRENKMTPEAWDSLVEFLLDYVTEPRDRAQARDLIWSASEDEFWLMLDALSGKKAAPPLPSSAN